MHTRRAGQFITRPLNRRVMRRVEIIWLFIIAALAVAACDLRPVPRVLKPEDVGARQLTELDGLGAQEGAAVHAAIARLAEDGTDAKEYYLAPIERRTDGRLELRLWYKQRSRVLHTQATARQKSDNGLRR